MADRASCLGRVTKARILEAVGEGVSDEAADRMDDMKKFDMALPILLRTAKPAAEQVDTPSEGRILTRRLPSEFQPGPRQRPRLIAENFGRARAWRAAEPTGDKAALRSSPPG